MVAGEREERRGHAFPLFLFGLLLGIAGTIAAPRLLGPRLPGVLRTGNLLEGRVLAKLVEGERLLLKVQTDQGIYLATFEQRQREIELLVDQGDWVTLEVRGEDPFPVGPAIRRVSKAEPEQRPAPAGDTGAAASDDSTQVPAARPEMPVPPEEGHSQPAHADSALPEPW